MKDIKRDKLLGVFIDAVKTGSLLVIGDPGIGKSWLLKKAVESIANEDIPHFFIQVDAIDVRSVVDFKKALGLDNPIQDVLNYVSGGKRSILFIDALDAARGAVKQNIYKQFIELIHKKCPNWSIVASIRTYDAKHSLELLNLFPAKSPELSREFQFENVKYRHLFIPPLSDEELKNFLNDNLSLNNLYGSANDKLKRMFSVPFNLWLLDTLLSGGIDSKKISDVQAVVQLFGLYWEFRVINKTDSEDRENILRKMAQIMVNNNSLSLWKKDLNVKGRSESLKGLLSDKLLIAISQTEERIAFEHNMIFDYVVSRLLIQEDPNRALSFLQEDQSRPIFLRPSIEYYFSRLWYSDQDLFWKTFWYFQYTKGNEYIHILPMITLVKEIGCFEDFIPVLEKLDKVRGSGRINCFMILNNIFRVLKVFRSSIEPLQGKVWVEIMYALNRNLNVIFIDEFIRTLKTAVDNWDKWAQPEQEKIGFLSRTILHWAWQPPMGLNKNQINSLHHMIAAWGVPLACKTFASDPKGAKRILSLILQRIRTPAFNIDEIYRLCNEVNFIWPYDPKFVIEIYKAVFGYEEKSQEMTAMRGGILSLTSNRRQDYEGCYYLLEQHFPNFLTRCPLYATRAMIEAVNKIVKRKEISNWRMKKSSIKHFQFFDVKTKYLEDGSSIWADREYRREHLKMLNDFMDYLIKLAQKNDADSLNLIRSLLLEIAKINEVAVVWKRLLRLCSENSSVFAPLLSPLLKSVVILTGSDTSYEAGEALKSGFVLLPKRDQEELENILLGLPDSASDKNKLDWLIKLRNTLLACIPRDILSKISKQILMEAEQSNKIIPNEPYIKDVEWSSKPYTNIDWLKEKGANLDSECNKKILTLAAPVKSFQEKFLNGIPSREEINEIFLHAKELKEEIEKTDMAYDELVKQDVLTDLASLCIRISRNDEVTSDVLRLCEEVFLLAASNQFPQSDKGDVEKFDSPHWGPAPRIEAAEGMMNLARRKEFITERNLKVIKALSVDKVPAVRYNIVTRLHFLYRTAEKEMWDIAFDRVNNEVTNGVITALAATISAFGKIKTKNVLDIFDIICKRKSIQERKKSGIHNDPCISTMTELVLFFNNKRSDLCVKGYEKNPLKYFDELQQVAISAINYLIIGLDEKEHGHINTKLVRMRTRQMLSQLLISADNGFCKLHKKYKKDEWPQDRKVLTKELYDIVDIIAK